MYTMSDIRAQKKRRLFRRQMDSFDPFNAESSNSVVPLSPRDETVFIAMTAIALMWLIIRLKEGFRSITAAIKWDEKSLKRKLDVRFREDLTLLVWYVIMVMYGYYTLTVKPWYFRGSFCKATADEEWSLYIDVYLYYLLQIAFYIQGLIYLVSDFYDRSDKRTMIFHHGLTLLLLLGSKMAFHHQVGALVIFIHDIVDIFLYSSQCIRYVVQNDSYKDRGWIQIGYVMFGLFIASYIYLRIYVLGYTIIWRQCTKVWYDNVGCVDSSLLGFSPWRPSWWTCHTLSKSLVGLLVLLFCLHLYWIALIYMMVKRVIAKGADAEDPRDREITNKETETTLPRKTE